MNVEIIALNNFQNEAKRLIKKFPSLKKELLQLENELTENPFLGVNLLKIQSKK